MTKQLSFAATRLGLALTLSALFSVAHAQSAEAGATKVASCIGCHGIPGYQSSFPEVHKVPKIYGQSAGYIVAALEAYKKGDRKHPTMRSVAGSMTEQDMADVAAYYESRAASDALKSVAVREPSEAVAGLLTKGACASCHGADYNKPIAPNYPKIGGQYADYLYVALKAYQTEGNPMVGRNNAVMSGIAKQFTHAELKLLANYLGTLPGPLQVISQSRFR